MVHLFFVKNPTEENQEEKLTKLLSLLQTYHFIPHDKQVNRKEGLQAILDHLETMTLTPSLLQWVEQDLIVHLNYYGIPLTKDFTNFGPS